MTPPVIQRWIDILHDRRVDDLETLIAYDAVFVSPVVFSPQEGKALTLRYLTAAIEVFGSDDFRYVEQWFGDRSAVLEFVTTVDGMQVNGVDMIHWNDAEQITSFKVMLRPIKGIQVVVPRMAALLQA